MLDKKDDSTLSDVCDGSLGRRRKLQKLHTRSSEDKIKGEGTSIAANSTSENDIVRKEMGLGWMLKSKMPAVLETNEIVSEEVQVEEVRLRIKFCNDIFCVHKESLSVFCFFFLKFFYILFYAFSIYFTKTHWSHFQAISYKK